MNSDRRRFMLALGRTVAATGLAFLSARLSICRRNGASRPGGTACPTCPLAELCPAKDGEPAGQNGSRGEVTHG